MALSIAKNKHRSLANPSLTHLFSSSPHQDAPNFPTQSPSEDQQQASNSSYFRQINASLKQQQVNQQYNPDSPHLRTSENATPSIPKPLDAAPSLDEIKKNLSEFRSRSSVPFHVAGPPNSDQNKQPSLQDLYKRRVNGKSEDTFTTQSSPTNKSSSVSPFEALKETLLKARQNAPQNTGRRSGDPVSFFNLNTRNESGPVKSAVIGGTEELPLKMFAKEQMSGIDNIGTEFFKPYSMDELGKKLRNLRPEVKEKGWFSLEELNERLRKLRIMEEEEAAKKWRSGVPIGELRASITNIKKSEEEKAKKNSIQTLNFLGQLGDKTNYMAHPPKDQLVDKYFHLDNMSSAEKLKLELANVREEFKMSESDCGSARVQVAQLTTKIKHLSSVLHKKDKHSRKGLNEMVQRRKKLLKYLRRTDWDSYCFVLSKLGLRDNADMKH